MRCLGQGLGSLGSLGCPWRSASSLSGVSIGGVSTDAVGKAVADLVVPPVIAAVKAQAPALIDSLRPQLEQQAKTMAANLQPVLVAQGNALVTQLRPQVEQQARAAFVNLQPMLDTQVTALEKRLDTFVQRKVEDIATGAEVKRLRRQATVALVLQALVILGGMYVIEKKVGH